MKRKRRLIMTVIVILIAAGFWFLQPLLLSRAAQAILEELAGQAEWNLRIGEVEVGLFQPVRIRDARLRPTSPSDSESVIHVKEATFRWANLPDWLGPDQRFFRSAEINGARVVLDGRREASGPPRPMRRLKEGELEEESRQLLPRLPRQLHFSDARFRYLGDYFSLAVSGMDCVLDETERADFTIERVDLSLPGFSRTFEEVRGITAWRDGTAYLAGFRLGEQIEIDQFMVDWIRPGGTGLGLEARCFSGTLRVEGYTGEIRGEPGLGMNARARRIDLAKVDLFFGGKYRMSGDLSDLQAVFRGSPLRLLDAEASVWLEASDFSFGNRDGDSLKFSANLLNRRLHVGNLRLRQEANSVDAYGSLAVSGRVEDLLESPYNMNVIALIPDVSSLVAWLPHPVNSLQGRMSMSAELSGRGLQAAGFLSAEASGVTFHGLTFESARLEAALDSGDLMVSRFAVSSGDDFLESSGSVALSPPHRYEGSIAANFHDLTRYHPLLPPQIDRPEGGLSGEWQGDGSFQSHSGAFSVDFASLKTRWTPLGITGLATGTYSPESLALRQFLFTRDRWSLRGSASTSPPAIDIHHVELLNNQSPRAWGKASLPRTMMDSRPALPDNTEIHLSFSTTKPIPTEILFSILGNPPPIAGTISGSAELTGPVETPNAHGKLSLSRISGDGPGPHIENLTTSILLEKNQIHFTDGSAGWLGGRLTFNLSAPIQLAPKPQNPLYLLAGTVIVTDALLPSPVPDTPPIKSSGTITFSQDPRPTLTALLDPGTPLSLPTDYPATLQTTLPPFLHNYRLDVRTPQPPPTTDPAPPAAPE